MAPTGKRRPHLSYSSHPETVEFIVGKDECVFTVTRSLLARYCDEFRTAMTNGLHMKEQIRLPELSSDVFRIFLRWLHAQDTPGVTIDIFWSYGEAEWQDRNWIDAYLVKLYVFAWNFGVPRFCRAVLDVFYTRYITTHRALPYSTMLVAFDHLPSHAPLCFLLVDIHCKRWVPREDEDGKTMEEELYWMDYMGVKGIDRPLNLCHYHSHPDERVEAICKTKYGISDIKNAEEPEEAGVDILRNWTGKPANFSRPGRGVEIPMVL
ncbi:uncharacterized protein BDZ99DRAFT_520682 [Mytilinidion resinicola]|uniref:BTB domain-containing protein n=1 Tax=Mytilinidion resinicola TaxID=574789 RepID=A0A6A6YKD0_9PEZI|nr:uncharacterized protein BDZ99DRAFT_520682 [Mytilinidion resinicola]KAF2809326.1 hypothetical protein BDZ99DRAFT_520682 [Mytilinidion resinicola]